jgi:hypothetical protein
MLPRNLAAPKSVAEAVEFLAPLEMLLPSWPTMFEAHVVRRIEAGNRTARTLNAALGNWYVLLKRYSVNADERPFLGVVLDVASRHFPGLIGLDAAGLRGMGSAKPLSAGAAAKRLGVSRDAVVAAIESGAVKAATRHFGERRVMF